jgi:uncharacterized Zn-finger protein
MLKCSGFWIPLSVSELYVRMTIVDYQILLHRCHPHNIVTMPETAPALSSTRYRPTKQYQCDICGKTFDSMEILNSHKRLDHSESGSQTPAGVS